METSKEMMQRMIEENEALGPEPSLEGSIPGTLSETWIEWFMARYRCSREIAILEGEDRLAVKGQSLKKTYTPPRNKS